MEQTVEGNLGAENSNEVIVERRKLSGAVVVFVEGARVR